MPKYQVAHLREQGQDMIIVPLAADYGRKTPQDQQEIRDDLQRHATSAGLRGTVVPVWPMGGGRMGFIAPKPWHPFFQSLSLAHVQRNLNREIYW